MNNNWKKEGMINGAGATIIFGLILVSWMIMIRICESLGVSPAWGILVFFVASIFSVTMSMAKSRQEFEKKMEETNK